ncbi:MAG: type II secretion system protein N [Burkholderiales bacterium]|nr:type II secretion system protein N [Burkholderiales bacterium]
MNRVVLWLLIAIVTIGFTLLAVFPASWMASFVERQTEGRITLGDAEGTLWHGSAYLGAAASSKDPVSPLLPGRFTWNLSPMILVGQIDATLENTSVLSNPLALSGTWNAWRISPASILLPAERLAGLGAPLNTIQPSGQMRLAWAPLQFTRQGNNVGVTGTMTLEMNNMASRLSPIKPLGAYILVFEWQGQQANMLLKTVKGPMLLSGTGQLANGRLQFSGKAEAEAGSEERLGNLLNLLGQRRREGNKNVIALEFK